MEPEPDNAHGEPAKLPELSLVKLTVPDGVIGGEGAAASLAMFPILFIIVVIQLWYIRRVEGA